MKSFKSTIIAASIILLSATSFSIAEQDSHGDGSISPYKTTVTNTTYQNESQLRTRQKYVPASQTCDRVDSKFADFSDGCAYKPPHYATETYYETVSVPVTTTTTVYDCGPGMTIRVFGNSGPALLGQTATESQIGNRTATCRINDSGPGSSR